MRLVNLRENGKLASACYLNVIQPMFIYHSTGEFKHAMQGQDYDVINDHTEYSKIIHKYSLDYGYEGFTKFVSVKEYNIWLRTIDEYIPDVADRGGNITYKLDSSGNKIPTDGCYVRLYYITPMKNKHALYTSSGVHSVAMMRWTVTAAVREVFTQERDWRYNYDKKEGPDEIYQRRLKAILNRKRQSISMVKLVMLMFNPLSDCYLDFNKACGRIYRQRVKVKDRNKILQTKQFGDVLMATLKVLFPDLAPEIRKVHNPQDMAKKLSEMWDTAKNNGNVGDMIDVFNKIKEVGYEDVQYVNDLTGLPTTPPSPHLESGSDASKETEDNNDTADSYLNQADTIDEVINNMKESVGEDYPQGYIMPSPEELQKDVDE